MANELKSQIAERIWLHYYNQELYRRSVITEQERNRMTLRIEQRKLPIRSNRDKAKEC